MNLTIECIRDENRFQSLEIEWNYLLELADADSIFLTWEWCSTWWDHFRESRQLLILTAREEQTGTLRGIAPLMIQPISIFPRIRNRPIKIKMPIKALSFIGSNGASPDHLDFITHPDFANEVQDLLLNSLLNFKKEWDVIQFKGISSPSSIIKTLIDKLSPGRYHLEESGTSIIDLPDTWEELYNQFNKRLRKNIRRQTRRFDEDFQGRVEHELVTNPDEIEPLIEKVVIFGRETRGEPVLRQTEELIQLDTFFVAISKRFFSKGWLRLFSLSIDQEVISIENIFFYNNKCYSYQTGYDQEWAYYSPGNRIFVLNIQNLINQKVSLLDLLRGNHEYKRRWATNFIPNSNILISCTPVGYLYLIFYKFGKKLKARFSNH